MDHAYLFQTVSAELEFFLDYHQEPDKARINALTHDVCAILLNIMA